MDEAATSAWLEEYLDVFAAFGRGDADDARVLLDYYATPLWVTTDDGVVALATEDAVVEAVRAQAGALRAAGYHHSETLTSELTALNARTALYAAEFSRRRADDSEIARLAARYLIVAGAAGRRIAALVVRGT